MVKHVAYHALLILCWNGRCILEFICDTEVTYTTPRAAVCCWRLVGSFFVVVVAGITYFYMELLQYVSCEFDQLSSRCL